MRTSSLQHSTPSEWNRCRSGVSSMSRTAANAEPAFDDRSCTGKVFLGRQVEVIDVSDCAERRGVPLLIAADCFECTRGRDTAYVSISKSKGILFGRGIRSKRAIQRPSPRAHVASTSLGRAPAHKRSAPVTPQAAQLAPPLLQGGDDILRGVFPDIVARASEDDGPVQR